MASIHEQDLFVWENFDFSSNLKKISSILKILPDEKLMKALETERGACGVNKYPVRAVWNSFLVGILVQHQSVESLRRELKRNPSLSKICGFNIFMGEQAIPSAGCYSRFLAKLTSDRYAPMVREIFEALRDQIKEQLPDYGESVAVDGKGIASYARKPGRIKADRRGDHDADWGKHTVRWANENGSGVKSKSWFGYALHLIADTKYELPLEYSVLPASVSEKPVARKLIKKLEEEQPDILNRCKYFCGDKGYDDKALISLLWDKHKINPIIDTRMLWKDCDTDPDRAYDKYDGVFYDQKGCVYCYSPIKGVRKTMAFAGFDKSRNALRFRCPAKHYGLSCAESCHCRIPGDIRIPLSYDPRIFTSVSRSSYKWKRLYNKRGAIERVNSRIDNVLGFEKHTVRGLKKMTLRMELSFILMMGFAVWEIQKGEKPRMRMMLSA